jgi:hypothetical protein
VKRKRLSELNRKKQLVSKKNQQLELKHRLKLKPMQELEHSKRLPLEQLRKQLYEYIDNKRRGMHS